MKKIIFILFFYSFAFAQSITPEVLSTCSLSYQNTQGSIDISVGESFVQTIGNSTNLLSQGFLQPNGFYPTAIEVSTLTNGDIQLYPNPCATILYIKTSQSLISKAVITNGLGQEFSISIDNSSIDLSILSQGIYHLSLFDGKTQTWFSHKIIKI